MVLHEKDKVYIQSYKHDGSLHRTWAKGVIVEANAQRIVLVTQKALVSESDGRKWITREPAVCFFYPDKWWNVISMIRKTGVHYYCNIASPSIYDGEAIKNIDYDLDIKVAPNGKMTILDEEEFKYHARLMNYGERLKTILQEKLQELQEEITKEQSPFQASEVLELYERYLMFR